MIGISYRYCVCCCKLTQFSLDRKINHASCSICSSRFAVKKPQKMVNQLNSDYKEKKWPISLYVYRLNEILHNKWLIDKYRDTLRELREKYGIKE